MTSLITAWSPNSFQLRLAFNCRKSPPPPPPPPVLSRSRVRKLEYQIRAISVYGKNGNGARWRRMGTSSMNYNSSVDAFSGWSGSDTDDAEKSNESPLKRWPGGIVGAGVAAFVLVAGLLFASLSISKGTSRPKQQMEPLTTQEEFSVDSIDRNNTVEDDGNDGKDAAIDSLSLESRTSRDEDSSSRTEIDEATKENELLDIDARDTSDGVGVIKSSSSDQDVRNESDVNDVTVAPLNMTKLSEPEVPIPSDPFAASSFEDSGGSFEAERMEASIEPTENLINEALTSSLGPDDNPTTNSNSSVASTQSSVADTLEDPSDINVLVIPFVDARAEPVTLNNEDHKVTEMPEISADGGKASIKVDNLSGALVSDQLVYPFANTQGGNDYNEINESRSFFESMSNGKFSSSASIPAPSVISPSLKDPAGKVLVPAVIDHVQGQALAALQVLKVIEADVQPGDLCTRREYARWLVSGSSALTRSSVSKVYPAMYIENATELAFDDITPEDPDFPSIQGLAEAGLIYSKLSRQDMSSSLDEEGGPLYFSPESPLSRQDLVSWKMSLEKRQLPVTDKKTLQEVSGFIDVDKIHPDALPALVSDLSAGEQGIVALAFGYTRLFQPNKPVTKAQAAIALATGEASDIVGEELARIEAESMAEKAVAANSALMDQVEKDLNASFEEELTLEKEKIQAVQKLAEETMKELEKLRAEREEENASLLKERATVDSEMELLLKLRGEVEEQLQSVMSNKIEISYEKERLTTLRRNVETENQEISRLKYELEVERKALAMARTWAEDEAKRVREQAKVLEEARDRWESKGIKVVVDSDLHEDATAESTWLNAVKQFSPEETTTRAETLLEKLKAMAAAVNGKARSTIEKVMEKIVLFISALKEWTLNIGEKAGKMREGVGSKVGESLEELKRSSAEFSLAVKERATRLVDDCKGGVDKLTHRFKA